jgi:hypothetical protein
MTIYEKCEAWLSGQRFTLFNRRQTARKGFEAGYATRRAEERDAVFDAMHAKRKAERDADRLQAALKNDIAGLSDAFNGFVRDAGRLQAALKNDIAGRVAANRERMRKAQRELSDAFNSFVGAYHSAERFKEFAAGWRACKYATHGSHLRENFSPEWLAGRSVVFRAGWHSRKIAELKHAFGSSPASFHALHAFHAKLDRETQNLDACRATLEGRNWFRDSSGRIWIDMPSEIDFETGLDAGIPIG